MPAKSKSQYRFFQMVKAYKKGDLKDASDKVKSAAQSMTMDKIQDYLSVNYDKLPENKLKLSNLIRQIGYKYIKNDKLINEVYHVSATKYDKLKNVPTWFALQLQHAEGWYESIKLQLGSAYIYKANIVGKISYIFDNEIKELFNKNNIKLNDWIATMVENPSPSQVYNHGGTKVLMDQGYDGIIYPDYNPIDPQKDLDALLIFKPHDSVKKFILTNYNKRDNVIVTTINNFFIWQTWQDQWFKHLESIDDVDVTVKKNGQTIKGDQLKNVLYLLRKNKDKKITLKFKKDEEGFIIIQFQFQKYTFYFNTNQQDIDTQELK